MNRKIAACLVMLVVLRLPGVAPHAMADCTVTAPLLDFGPYNTLSPAPSNAVGRLSYRCQGGDKNVTIALAGMNTSSACNRAMTNNGYSLAYVFYLDAAQTTVWGDGACNTQLYSDPSPHPNTTISVPLYAKIIPLQNVPVAPYQDSTLVTISWQRGGS